MVRNFLKIIIITSLLLLTSCERLIESSTILAGNQKFKSGDYQGSIIDYLTGLDSQTNRDYFYYNLGNVYSSLGESPSAFAVWNMANGDSNSSLKFSLLYNKGYLEFQEGNYELAYNHFKQALLLMPSSIKAKINLELSLNKMSAATYNQAPDSVKNSGDIGATDETKRILEYVRQKEAMTWGLNYQEEELENDW
ncbi:tetratricopeptide repeat protein [Thiospirochaeta perfilievii]|uniref:Tetratricopeptide repeat protein n=1 Tax=Thiospirochaeta perfilievii TaxID=252967 RepID=A0A5C1QFM4_9SPIO|nr:tetratricopeptide repeat protein [Thiospirochaeta perfilievii]QEN05012.1 tetratricopeptide repeat protein [Thiospirochaeta perfilievii]